MYVCLYVCMVCTAVFHKMLDEAQSHYFRVDAYLGMYKVSPADSSTVLTLLVFTSAILGLYLFVCAYICMYYVVAHAG
jgi:hypothetical protein